jgi:hypothetical protein
MMRSGSIVQSAPLYGGNVWWQPLWFLLHLAAIYILVGFCTTAFAGWVNRTLFPFLKILPSPSGLEFLFAHLFAFSFLPAFIAGLANAKFKHKAAEFVWIVPAIILSYKLLTFPNTSSVLYQSQSSSVLHYYFGGAFLLPDAHVYGWGSKAYWAAVSSNADAPRALAQLNFTAPLYAGVAYSVASWLGIQMELSRRFSECVNRWKERKFGKEI